MTSGDIWQRIIADRQAVESFEYLSIGVDSMMTRIIAHYNQAMEVGDMEMADACRTTVELLERQMDRTRSRGGHD